MKLKKMLTGFMTLCMLATTMPVIAWAEDVVSTSIPTASYETGVNVKPGGYDLTYYMKFETDEEAGSKNVYDDWIIDFTIKFSEDFKTPDGYYLYGNLGGFEQALNYGTMDIEADEEYRVVKPFADAYGVVLTYAGIRDFLGVFPCGLYLPDDFLDNNSDLIVTLSLNLYNPADETDVKTIASYSFNAYTVTFDAKDGSDPVQQIVPANGLCIATKPADPVKEGFTFDGWYKDAEYLEAFDFSTAVTGDMTLYAKWEAEQPVQPAPSSGSSSPKYPVSVDKNDSDNGTVKLSSTKAKKGSTVTLTITPEPGYEMDKLIVLDKDGKEVELTDEGNGRFTFKMPRGGVDVEPSFVEIDEEDVPLTDLPLGKENVLVLTIGQLLYQLNDKDEVNDVAPVIQNDRTFLPIRLIAESLGATVGWDEAEQSVTIVKDGTTIVIYIGQAFATVNGEPVQLDAPAFIANDRTYLPVRFVAENLGATVSWDAETNKVTIVG